MFQVNKNETEGTLVCECGISILQILMYYFNRKTGMRHDTSVRKIVLIQKQNPYLTVTKIHYHNRMLKTTEPLDFCTINKITLFLFNKYFKSLNDL